MRGDILDFAMIPVDESDEVDGNDFLTNIEFLEHSGVKGMKWHLRRYQNEDGSLTPLGRIHYGIAKRKEKNGNVEVAKNRGRESEDGLESNTRDKAEKSKNVHKLSKEDMDKAKKAAGIILGTAAAGVSVYAAYKYMSNKKKGMPIDVSGAKNITSVLAEELSGAVHNPTEATSWYGDYGKARKAWAAELLNTKMDKVFESAGFEARKRGSTAYAFYNVYS